MDFEMYEELRAINSANKTEAMLTATPDVNSQEPTVDTLSYYDYPCQPNPLMNCKSVNEWIADAKTKPDAKSLYMNLWYEGEVSCLFADSNLGKSILAVQIAEHIARSQKVLYCDCELSDKQFQQRYTDEHGEVYRFPDNLERAEIDIRRFNGGSFDEAILGAIRDTALHTQAKVIIIDNLTWLCNQSESGDAAGWLMLNLINLKREFGWSILVIAHTPKRDMRQPITQNDLAGSKRLFNFFDSVFAIGQSAQDANQRYIKQIKVRAGAFTFDADNVALCEIDKVDGLLQFVITGQSPEQQHLRMRTADRREMLKTQARELADQGLSFSEIGKKLMIPKATAHRYATA